MVAFIGAATVANTNSGTSLTLTKPAGLANGEMLFEAEMFRQSPADGTTNPTTPSGWTIQTPTLNDNGQNATFRKVITNAAGEPASYTFASGQSANRACAVMARVTGINTSTPVDAAAATASSGQTAGSINTVTPGALLVMFAVVHISATGTYDLTVAGMTRIGQVQCGSASSSVLAVFAEARPSAGATGTRTSVLTGGTAGSATSFLLALRPAAAFGAPANLAYTDVANGANRDIQITWDSVSGATGYDVERDGVIIAPNIGAATYTDSARPPTTFHSYRVRARN
jgi:hypothetical protein